MAGRREDLNQQHGVELNAFADVFQLVWTTTWEHGANRLILEAALNCREV
jgi:hypothetical protein